MYWIATKASLLSTYFLFPFGLCYIIPTITLIFLSIIHKKLKIKEPEKGWLFLLFLGAVIFGLVDHLWNGEIFLIGENPIMDIVLGIIITFSVFIVWRIIVYIYKIRKREIY
ncbi:MAG: hypothetical protein N2323_00620 [candidate division WOR-3 bacterium]|nr:hypothetical protein [candidate division WOR-3 bacterium]MCX7836448.1 hypothetical protein [candidate division WOR-3 bacterium]MDW8114207.1 hypothetical protein [candidate division WOR-3 bacterium]